MRHNFEHSRKDARSSGEDVIFGRQPVMELMRAGRRRLRRVTLQQGARLEGEFLRHLEKAQDSGVKVVTVDARALDHLCEGGHHQGVAVAADPYPYVSLEEGCGVTGGEAVPFLLLLDHVQDPQNLGSLLRTAEVCGVTAAVIPKDRAVGVTPAVVRASAGASEHMRVAKVVNLAQCMRSLKDDGVRVVGLEALPEAPLLTESDLTGPLALVLGSEGEGLGRLVRETCDALARIPVLGKIGSLNVSIAGAVAMFEAVRQRGKVSLQERRPHGGA